MPDRLANTVSSYSLIKGALVDETCRALAAWDLGAADEANWQRLRSENPVGAQSDHWLRDVIKVLHLRFAPSTRDRALTELAQSGCSAETWRPILLWHWTRHEFLLRDWLVNWLFARFTEGVYRLQSADVVGYLAGLLKRRDVVIAKEWSPNTMKRTANGLLRAAADFGLLTGTVDRTFASYHPPEVAFLYVLHAMAEVEPSAGRVLSSSDWHIYLMDADDVERELLRLHQYRRLDYRVAGSLAQLQLPQQTALEYVREVMT